MRILSANMIVWCIFSAQFSPIFYFRSPKHIHIWTGFFCKKRTILIAQLTDALKGELPGFEAQLKMASAFAHQRPQFAADAMDAGVLVLFYQKNGEWYFPLIQRPSRNPKDPHNGQVAFPGGRYEDEDTSFAMTALREANEEVGIKASDVQVVGKLSPLYIPVSRYLVHPLVGYLPYAPSFILQEAEVHSVIEVPLSQLLDPSRHKQKDMPFSNRGSLRNVHYFDLEGKVVWGATAMMLSELLTIFQQTEMAI